MRSDLDEAKRKASRLSQEHRELSLRLEDTEKDKETLKQTINQLEEIKQQQDRALEKLSKEVRKRDPFIPLQTMKACAAWSILTAHYKTQRKRFTLFFSLFFTICSLSSPVSLSV